MYSFKGAFYYTSFEIKEDKFRFAFFFHFRSVFFFHHFIHFFHHFIIVLIIFPYIEIRKSVFIHFFIDNFTNRRKITNTICFQGYE